MRFLTLLVSIVFTVGGIGMIAAGDSTGWFVAGFFGFCLLVAMLDPSIPKPKTSCDYRLLITRDEIACEHPKRTRESIRWEDVTHVWYVTTSDGPWLPDEWLVLEGENGGCSLPTEASGFDDVWGELKQRFPGLDYEPFIRGGTDDARHLCWERQRLTHG